MIPILTAGLALGFAHAFEPDHVAAVTTLAVDRRPGRSARFAPLWWAAGHGLGLFVFGLLAIAVSSSIPLDAARWAEGLVGPILILLGVRTIVRSGIVHQHHHEHRGGTHEHYHFHVGAEEHHHAADGVRRARARHAPVLVGAVHGIAGTGGAVVLAASAGFTSLLSGVVFLAAFGIGTVAAMGVYSGAFALAAGALARREPLVQTAMLLCGCVSAGIGSYLIAARVFAA